MIKDIIPWIIVLIVSVICGLISINTVMRFLDYKIKQESFEYQICGYIFANIAVFGTISSIPTMLRIIFEYIFSLI